MLNELDYVISIHPFNLGTNLKAGAEVKLHLLSICEWFGLILRGIGVNTGLLDSVFDVSISDHLCFSEVELVQSNLNKPNET